MHTVSVLRQKEWKVSCVDMTYAHSCTHMSIAVCCSEVLQCVAVKCCSVLQWSVAVCLAVWLVCQYMGLFFKCVGLFFPNMQGSFAKVRSSRICKSLIYERHLRSTPPLLHVQPMSLYKFPTFLQKKPAFLQKSPVFMFMRGAHIYKWTRSHTRHTHLHTHTHAHTYIHTHTHTHTHA